MSIAASISKITEAKWYKVMMPKLYGWGASLVIIGALFKIQNWPFAGLFLTIGLTTEAVIFFFSAFEKQYEDYDWSLVYPELAHMQDPSAKKPAQQLDEALQRAKIDNELIESLNEGLRSFGGFSFLAEYIIATATDLKGSYKSTPLFLDNQLANNDAQLFASEISEFLSLGSGLNTQLGYMTKSGFSIDLAYSMVEPEFEKNTSSIISKASSSRI